MKWMAHILIGVTLTLLSACQPPVPDDNFPPPVSGTGATATEELTDAPNEAPPLTTDSLEVGRAFTGTTLAVTALPDAILMGSAEFPRLTIFDDYACFYCHEFLATDLPWIIQTYGERLAIERVFLPRSYASELMVKTALCALKKDKFLEADAALHAKPIATEKEATTLATKLKLNPVTFKACLASAETTLEMNAMKSRATAEEITRVPAFKTPGDAWIGILTRIELQKKIEKAF